MQCLFYVHGTPKGQCIWGAEEYRDYIKTCYTGEAEEKVRFVIDISPRTNRTYFTYLCCKSFFSADNRPGAYFGMTLNIDGLYYCKDTVNLYKLFDQIYENYIANGTIVARRQDKEVYLVSTFAEKNSQLEEIRTAFMKTFKDSFVETGDVRKIEDKDIAKASSTPQRYNLVDVDSIAFRTSLCNNLKVYVSKEYPTKDILIAHLNQQITPEKEKSRQMAEKCSELQEQLNNVIRERDSLKQKISTSDTTKQQLERALRDKEQRISDLELRNKLLEKEHTKQQLETTIRQIHPQIKELSQKMNLIAPDKQQDNEYPDEHKCIPKSIVALVTLCISVLCFLMLAFVIVFLLYSHKQIIAPNKKGKPKVETPISINSSFVAQIGVDFDNNRGDYIYQDSTYAVYAQNIPAGSRKEWKMDGFDIVGSGDRTSQQVRVRANKGAEKAVLSLYVDGNKEWSHEYIVQK